MSARDTAALDEVRDAFATLDGPVIVYNKSHSGSRLLARLLAEGGVFMGAQRNASEDALPVFDLVEALVRAHYPDYSRLWSGGAEAREAAELARRSFERHLAGFDRASAAPWGWKLCESAYAMPVLAHLFPRARVIHLVRDGRDVAFCDHRGPDSPFWRKIYFDTDRIATWRGLALTGPAYRRRSHLYNALHWSSAVRVGRAYGAMLGARYLEVRYEDLCTDFAPTAARVLRFAGAPRVDDAVARIAPTVRQDSLGKHRRAPLRAQREVVGIAKAELLSFGYLDRDPERPARSLLDSRLAERVVGRLRGRSPLAPWRRAPKARGED